MTFATYASGSDGNTHTLTSASGQAIVLDAGVRAAAVLRNHAPSSIAAVLVTHSHGDHAAYVREYTELRVPCFAPFPAEGVTEVKSERVFTAGEFRILPLAMRHDVPCLGYLIRHPDVDGDILYATDTNGIPWTFGHLALAIAEADYSDTMLNANVKAGKVDIRVAERTRRTHNSLTQAIEFLDKSVGRVDRLVLCHLSAKNAISEAFARTARALLPGCREIRTAKAGLMIDMQRYAVFSD